MDIQYWLSLFAEQAQQTSAVEWVAVIFGVTEVLLARRNHILLYPAGIISTVLIAYIMFDSKLYAEALLNAYYLIMSVYGWIHWARRRNEPALPITHTQGKEWAVVVLIAGLGWAVLYGTLSHYTDAHYPTWDAWVSSTAWAGMWLLARRKVENWLLLNLSNLFAVPLLFYKALPMMACLTIFLFIIAVLGYFDWRKKAVKTVRNREFS
ncbi:nicotinamide riboside transporter PnuC [Filimonas effusa]|uniref:Nicotinamide riboside transporter PnuC n=1 Tax=Filimonas effusa TaxID=2508721 RepID=A0A4Q1D7V6_9BACT|nr:nicotinamide riboside transporter PnuC [Filimonas effusa]RXK83797.1 nicotinamide riboside transporter PnuC [Filimonas effusa]